MLNLKTIMVNFEKGQLIGIDIGLSAIKIALISQPKKGIFRLDKYISYPLTEAAIIEDEIQKPEEIIEGISTLIKELWGSKKKLRVWE